MVPDMREMKDSGVSGIGRIPKEWKVERAKYIVDQISKGNGITKEQVADDGDIQCVRYGEIYSKYDNSFRETFSLTNLKSISSPKHISNGDILFAGTGELIEEIGKNIVYLGDRPCLAGGDIVVLRHSQEPRFLNYAFNCACSQKQKSENKAKLKVVHITGNDIGNIRIAFPNKMEQKRIADFLDDKCAEIDAISADIQTEIDTLEAYKRSVITEAVTKGLDKNVPMKDSNVEWIGQVPEDWGVSKLGNVLRLRNEKNYKPLEEVNLISLYTDKGVVQHSDLEKTSGNIAQNADGYKVVHKNDIVVNIILAWMGAMGISKYEGVTSPAYDVYEIDEKRIVPHYCHYILRTPAMAGECYKYGRGIMMMRWRTYSSEFKKIKMPLPTLREQAKIADYLDDKSAEIESIIAQKQEQLTILAEYKKSIIYEYVTGKKEVPVT